MGRQSNKGDAPTFNLLTEALRRGRKRIRPEYWPELTAWLLVQSYQYERILDHFRSLATRPDDPVLKGNGEYAKHALSVIQTLLNNLSEGFDRFHWEGAKEEVAKHIHVDELGNHDMEKGIADAPFDLKSGV